MTAIRLAASGCAHGLLAQAPNSLATVIELKYEGEPRQVLGAGHVMIDDDPWRESG